VTAAVVALRARTARLGLVVGVDTVALTGLAVVVVVLALVTWGTWGDLDSDTGYDVVAGWRVAHGDLPYADFTYYYGPLAPALTGLAALIGGSGFGPAIALGLLITAAIIGVTYALARTLMGPLAAFLAAALVAEVAFIPNNYGFVLPHTFAATLGTLFLLVFLLLVRKYAGSERPAWLVGAGFCAGLLTLTKPEVTFAALVVAAVWLFLRARAGARARREVALFAAPLLAVPVAVYGAFLTAVPLHRLVFDNLYPSGALKAGGNELVKARMPLTVDSFVTLGGRLLLYAVGIAAMLYLARVFARPSRLRRPLIVASAGAVLLVLAAAAMKPDSLREGFYYFYGWIPAGAAIACVVLWRRRRSEPWDADAQTRLAVVLALAAVALTTYGAFVTHGWKPQMAVYYIPLAAIFLAGLHLGELARTRAAYVLGALWLAFLVLTGTGLTLKDARAESATVSGPGGSLAETPREAALYSSALRWIETTTQPGDPILVAPILTGLYPLSGREDVLREVSLIPSALPTAADERAAIARLEDAGVRLAITDQRTWKGYGQTSFGDSFDRILATWIHRNFKHAATLRTEEPKPRILDVWTR
jgi:dolichyl-phosphate-mannose-protein mannosyltransferase